MKINFIAHCYRHKKVWFWFERTNSLSLTGVRDNVEDDIPNAREIAESLLGSFIEELEGSENIDELVSIDNWSYTSTESIKGVEIDYTRAREQK